MKLPLTVPTSAVARNALVLIAVVASGAALYWLRDILTPLAMAIFLMIMIDGVKRSIEGRTGLSPHWAGITALLVVMAGFIFSIWIIIDGASGYWAGLLDECPGADAGASWLAGASCWIDECYAADDAVTIVQALADHPAPDARASAETIRARSPLSVALALRAVRRARELPDVAAVLDQDRALARTTMADPADFVEGVRAKMVDRDDRPRWRHARLADVDEAEVAARFVG